MSSSDEASHLEGVVIDPQYISVKAKKPQKCAHGVPDNAKDHYHEKSNPADVVHSKMQHDMEDGIFQLEPQFRKVPVNVRRKSDRRVRAEPPPVNPPRASLPPSQNPSQRRMRAQKGLGDGSDSDSEDDDKRKPHRSESGSGTVTRRRPQPPAVVVERPVKADRRELEEEEERRIQEMRIMREVEEKWPEIYCKRMNFQYGTRHKRRDLIRFYEDSQAAKQKAFFNSHRDLPGRELQEAVEKFKHESYDPFWFGDMQGFISHLDQQRRDYLDEALYRNIEDHIGAITGDISSYSSESWRSTLVRIEMGFLRRCRKFDRDWNLHYDEPPPNLPMHLIYVMKNISGYLRSSTPERFRQSHIRPPPPGAESALATNYLVEEYIDKVLNTLSQALKNDSLRSLSQNAMEAGSNPQARSLQTFYKFIANSRYEGRLTNEYRDWVWSSVDTAEVKRCCLRATALSKYRDFAKSVKMDIRQEFCPGIVQKGVMSLVMLKGTLATSIKEVSSDDLYTMGWFWDENLANYWRFEIDCDAPTDAIGKKSIFKVSMDGETLGMFVGNGEFLEWNDNMSNLQSAERRYEL